MCLTFVSKLLTVFIFLILQLVLQGNCAQQGLPNNQNGGVNNAIGFQQQALQRTNTPNNMNQTPNGGLNTNLPQQSNFQQQGNLQQPISGNFQGNLQPSLSVLGNLQPQGGSVSLGNIQFTKQGLQLPPGLVINQSKSQSGTQTNTGCRSNAQQSQQQNNVGPTSNTCASQTQPASYSSNSLAELAALKGHPSLLSLFASQNNIAQPQQNQQMANFNPSQNQLTDLQKQFLVRAIQSQSSGQSQPSVNFAPTQFRVAGPDNRQTIAVQGAPVTSQQPQAIVTPIASQQPYITVQAQPLTNYVQNQQPQLVEEPSYLNLILAELQGSDPQFNNMYPPYQVQKRESKSSLKTLIPLIINLLKEKSNCGCQNCGCPNNGCGTNNAPEPTIFGGYSSLMNYGQGAVESTTKASDVEGTKSKSNKKDKKSLKKNVVNVDSEEVSDEYYSEEEEDSEEE